MEEQTGQGPDCYCDEVLSGHTPVAVVAETENVLAYRHPRPRWPDHVVVIPKQHVASLLALEPSDAELWAEMVGVVRRIAERMLAERRGCRVETNVGNWQINEHVHVVEPDDAVHLPPFDWFLAFQLQAGLEAWANG